MDKSITTRRVLFIAYYFPPDGGAGTQRVAMFCKYLAQCGWNCDVITRAMGQPRSDWSPEDQTLLCAVHGNANVIRVEVQNRGDARGMDGWRDSALAAAIQRITTGTIDAVVVTMSPFESAWIGREIQRRAKVPVIYDLRDPWALDGWRLYSSRAQWTQDFQEMVDTLRSADAVIANTEEAKMALLKSVCGLRESQIHVIPNGFDGHDFDRMSATNTKRADEGLFHLVHSGTWHTQLLYKYEGFLGPLKKLRHYRPEPIDPSGRTPLHLLRAVRQLREADPSLASRLRLVFVGRSDPALQRCVSESGVADMVALTGYLPHHECLRWLQRASALFLPLHGLPPGRRSLIVPGKLYEYLGAQKPILACLPPGDARDIVSESGFGTFADPCDAAQIAAALAELMRSNKTWTTADGKRRLPNTLRRFTRQRLARKLEEVLSKFCRTTKNRAALTQLLEAREGI